ncbi:conserved hypothetical protein [Talaromyces stipitatus ATCC 10500]|uniref:F-box domain-containing protein n=1 Tax=Talaromyces stipitatus (strain ATCC 10500 / CBS 375.48 / QM 6759 / NRRL 1006) TaxID=441959 RepID=B8MS52_TALSN|nr:uncharacterized protein TSTA_004950 [Talaromyces stipitatus ATCC 10500]EED12457.1 conserved hypothetical protein [Talaromyces stipitatus ATCC 10500]
MAFISIRQLRYWLACIMGGRSFSFFARLKVSKAIKENPVKETTVKEREVSPERRLENNPPQEPKCFIMDLPTELLVLISAHLDPLSEACLALTCKRLLLVSGRSFLSESLRFQKDFAPLFHHYRASQTFSGERWKLIERLEDGRWLACSKCLKLHLRTAFPARELRSSPTARVCSLGESAGVVDLCPCIKMTFQDKVNLIKHLKDREVLTKMPSAIFGSRGYDERYLWHSCTVAYESTEFKIDIYPELNDAEQLIIRTEYRMTTVPHTLGKQQHITTRLGCAHRSIDLWLSSVCQALYCHRHDTFCRACRRISTCGTCGTVLKCPQRRAHLSADNDKATYYFWTLRCLGNSTQMPDGEFAAQRMHPISPHISIRNCPWTLWMHPPPIHAPSLDSDILQPALEDNSVRFANQMYSSLQLGQV